MFRFLQNHLQANVNRKRSKAIPLQAGTGPEDSRRLKFPDFKTIGTSIW